MEINNRISQIIDHYRLEQKDFAQKIGTTPGNISKLINGLTSPGGKILESILVHYPEISAEWLMRGKGEMLISNMKSEFPSVTRAEFEELLNNMKELQKEIAELKKSR